MKKIIFLFLFAMLSSNAFAEAPAEGLDEKISGGVQTYPLGLLATAELGYGKKIWASQNEQDENFWQYAYVRPYLELETSVVTNRITGALQFYPISIFGITAGGGFDDRNYRKFSGVDCNNVMCDQTIDFKFVKAQLVAGLGKLLVIANGRYDWYRSSSADQEFYDYMSYLIGRAGSDDLRSLNVVALYRQSSMWNFGALGIYQSMVYSQSNNSAVYGILSYTAGPWQGTVGLGDYHSDFKPQHASAIFSLKYTFEKSIALIH